jgi:hypothetical protein
MMTIKTGVFWGLLLILLFCGFEALSFFSGKLLQQKWAMWRVPGPPKGAKESISYEEYLRRRHPVLGWPYLTEYGDALEVNGAHRNPHFPDGPARGSCVALYGDSFTHGGDVSSDANRWGNVLSKELGCYVANFGTGGYGTDQAYLRFVETGHDASGVVILGVHPANVIRNLTRIRDLENYQKWFALKPRYVFERDGRLSLVPLPRLTEEEYLRVLTERQPQLVLEHETLHPGGPAGAVKLRFPYTISLVENMVRFYGFRSRLLGYPDWMPFLEPEHPLGGLGITVGITREFAELARRRAKQPLVLLLPHPDDVAYYRKRGRWPYQPIMDEYRRHAIEYLDFGPFLIAAAEQRGRNLKTFFGPTGHYNDDGNALLARFVYRHLSDRRWVKSRN